MSDEDDQEKELVKQLNEVTKDLLANLSVREAKVLRTRFGIDLENNHSLEEVGKQLDVTRQRIRDIEEKALKKLRDRGLNDDDPDAV